MLTEALLAFYVNCAVTCDDMPPRSARNTSPLIQAHSAFVADLEALLSRTPDVNNVSERDARVLGRLRERVREAENLLNRYHNSLDPVFEPSGTFHPGSYQNVAEMIVSAMRRHPRRPLGAVSPYYGSGIYCLYYHGNHPAYALISGTEIPIYAGAASPANFKAVTPRQQGLSLYTRQRDHASSIREAESHALSTLRIEDFTCCELVVESGWEVAAESYLIKYFQPVWNKETKVCQGLGKHGDRSSTRSNRRSSWDTLHPGREWATEENNRPNRLTQEEIIHGIWRHCLDSYPVAWMDQNTVERVRAVLPPPPVARRGRNARNAATPLEDVAAQE